MTLQDAETPTSSHVEALIGMPVRLVPSAPGLLPVDFLRESVAARSGARLRIARPRPTVAFGRLDAHRRGFARAEEAARSAGYTPWVRDVGGRAAVYDEGCLVFDLASADLDPYRGTASRFAGLGFALVTALRGLGVDARLGRVPDEYCPGTYSVNARGRTKLAGTAQRVVKGGWLVSGVLTVGPADRVRGVVADVYAALDLPLDVASVGSVVDEVGPVAVPDVELAIVRAFGAKASW